MWTVAVRVAAIAGLSALSLLAAPQPTASKSDVARQLQSWWAVTKLGARQVKQQGAILVIRQNGIGAVPGSGISLATSSFKSNYKDGRIRHDKLSELVQSRSLGMRDLGIGERVYLLKLQVSDSSIVLDVQSCGDCDPSAIVPNPYRATITFPFEKGFLETSSVDQIEDTLSAVLSREISAAATVQPGQSTEEVTGILGQPEKIEDQGSKKIFVYKDLKITFVEGKVSDVQ